MLGPLRATDADGRPTSRPTATCSGACSPCSSCGGATSCRSTRPSRRCGRAGSRPTRPPRSRPTSSASAGSCPTGVVASAGTGYRVDAGDVELDADRLAQAVTDAGALAAADPAGRRRPAHRGPRAWRGAPYPELADTDAGRAEAGRLDELRIRAVEARADALLRAGAADDLVGELQALADEQPLRERPRELLMAALAAAGRHVEAMRVYDDFRRLLADELGVEPSPALAARHVELLRGGAGVVRPRQRLPSPADVVPRPRRSSSPTPSRWRRRAAS